MRARQAPITAPSSSENPPISAAGTTQRSGSESAKKPSATNAHAQPRRRTACPFRSVRACHLPAGSQLRREVVGVNNLDAAQQPVGQLAGGTVLEDKACRDVAFRAQG